MSAETCNCGPGQSANLASAVVGRAVENAKRADRLALLARLRGPDCCQGRVSPYGPQQPSQGILISQRTAAVVASGPKGNARVLTSGVYIDNLTRETIEAERDQFNADTRFSRYNRYQPAPPCPTYTRNPAVPAAPTGNCYPSRFYGSGRYY
jgi:hypothetical protein